MAPPTVPDGFMPLILRCAALGIIPIALLFNRLTSNAARPRPGALWPSFLAVALTGLAWQATVSLWVPEPYLDEIFHIPQAQKYCDGYWTEWDDKITTPPGLYLFSVAAHRLWWLLLGGCSPLTLRMTNWLTIITVPVVASHCRRLIEARLADRAVEPGPRRSPPRQHDAPPLSSYALHTGVNVAFFPLLFFFSGLYYTDVLSTLVVLVAFGNTLARVDSRRATSWRSDFSVVLLATASLLMRQTNVFWAVVFMGGLEAVHAAGALRPPPTRPGEFDRQTKIKFYLSRYAQGEIHDPPLDAASLDDVLYCALSIGIAVICNPIRVLRQIWAHILTMVLFAGFVFWNGGVVLGDKSNHVATIHLPQMLYIWPLFAFFSAPPLLPTVVQPVLSLFAPAALAPFTSPSKPAPTTTTPTVSRFLNIAGYAALVPAALAIVRFNTIIHPFTLADNRHYMFYVFRYSILRAPWVRYALVPVYVASGVLCLKALCGGMALSSSYSSSSSSGAGAGTGGNSSSILINGPVLQKKGPARKGEGDDPKRQQEQDQDDPPPTTTTTTTTLPPALSTTLLFVLTTTLSLVTAPLVEPRYFILPWVFWRLLLPAWSPPSSSSSSFLKIQNNGGGDGGSPDETTNKTSGGGGGGRRRQQEDSGGNLLAGLLPLWLETAWFGLINLATMYVFVTKPFRWASEEGASQRFMW